jgi:hypothetical protein
LSVSASSVSQPHFVATWFAFVDTHCCCCRINTVCSRCTCAVYVRCYSIKEVQTMTATKQGTASSWLSRAKQARENSNLCWPALIDSFLRTNDVIVLVRHTFIPRQNTYNFSIMKCIIRA